MKRETRPVHGDALCTEALAVEGSCELSTLCFHSRLGGTFVWNWERQVMDGVLPVRVEVRAKSKSLRFDPQATEK